MFFRWVETTNQFNFSLLDFVDFVVHDLINVSDGGPNQGIERHVWLDMAVQNDHHDIKIALSYFQMGQKHVFGYTQL